MEENRIGELLSTAAGFIYDIPYEQWPIDELDELAYSVIPLGDSVRVVADETYEIALIEGETSVFHCSGLIPVEGSFMGFQPLDHDDENGNTVNLLTIRLDYLDGSVVLIPVEQISSLENTEVDPMVIVGFDEFIENLHVVLGQEKIKFSVLKEMFAKLDPDDIKTKCYLDYLNKQYIFSELFDAIIVNGYIIVSPEGYNLDIQDENQIVDVADGKSFTLVGVRMDNGEEELILCVNAVINGNTIIRVPLEHIVGLIS